MSEKTKAVGLRFARVLAATVVALVAAWVVSPEVLNLVPESYRFIVVSIIAPLLVSLDKYLRVAPDKV